MPIHEKYSRDFEYERVYHVYNRTNNREKLFVDDVNFEFFLDKAYDYLYGYLDFLSWNLIPNHFHFAIKIKSELEIRKWLEMKNKKKISIIERKFLDKQVNESVLIENAFKRLFQSYTMSFNKMYDRKGNLFYKNFRRILIESDEHFTQIVVYVNVNSLKHGVHYDYETYKWSSWQHLISEEPGYILKNFVIDWFGGRDKMIEAVRSLAKFYYESEVSIED